MTGGLQTDARLLADLARDIADFSQQVKHSRRFLELMREERESMLAEHKQFWAGRRA